MEGGGRIVVIDCKSSVINLTEGAVSTCMSSVAIRADMSLVQTVVDTHYTAIIMAILPKSQFDPQSSYLDRRLPSNDEPSSLLAPDSLSCFNAGYTSF